MRSMADEEEDARRGVPHESPKKKQKTSEQLEAKQELQQSPVKIEQEPMCSPVKRRQAYMSSFFSPKVEQKEEDQESQASASPLVAKQERAESQASSSMRGVQNNFEGATVGASPEHKQATRQDFVEWGKKGGRPKKEEDSLRYTGKSAKEKYKARAQTEEPKLRLEPTAARRVSIVEQMQNRRDEFGKGEQEETAWLMACKKEQFSEFTVIRLRKMVESNERDRCCCCCCSCCCCCFGCCCCCCCCRCCSPRWGL
jgi:hypothetical protein